MKIFVVCHEHPPLGGGGGNAAAQMSRQLARLGHTVVFATSHFAGLPLEEVVNGYRVVRIDSGRSSPSGCSIPELVRFYMRARPFLLQYLDRSRPDALLAYFTLPGGLLALDAKRRFGIPYYLSLQGGDVPGFLGKELGWYQWAAKPLIRAVWRNAACVFGNSNYLARLAELTSDRPIDVVPNGFYTDDFKPDPAARPSEYVSLLFSGRLVPQKGVRTLLEALGKLANRNFRLNIIGSGPLEGTLKKLTGDLHLENLVTFCGWVSRDRILPYYQKAHALVLPSHDEGMPNVVNEAIACGTAIIGTSAGGIPELIQEGHNGRIVPPGDTYALARVLDELLAHPEELLRMGENSLTLSRSCTWADSAAIFSRLLNYRANTQRIT